MKKHRILLFTLIIFFNNQFYSQSIIAYKYNDLDFGDVFIGYSENVDANDSRAAKFFFYHSKFLFSDLLVTFNLPSSLTNGIDKLPIEFNYQHASWSYRNSNAGRRNFNPKTPLELRRIFLFLPVNIWLGGKIETHTGLSPGKYNGTITLTIEYL